MSDLAIQEAVRSIESGVRDRSGVGVSEVRRRARLSTVRRSVTAGVVLVLAFLGFRLFSDTDPYDTSGGVISSNLNVLVGAPVEDRPGAWVGLPAEAPRFDTSGLGEPQLVEFRDAVAPPEDTPAGDWIEIVYLGDLDGEPQFVYSVPAPSIFDRVAEALTGNASGRLIGTTLDCCTSDNSTIGEPNTSRVRTSDADGVVEDWTNLFWLNVPDGTSVVAAVVRDEPILWQRPVSNVFIARTAGALYETIIRAGVTFIAFDAEGNVIESVLVGR